MAEAFLQQMDHSLEVFSAGLHPVEQVDPFAIQVMLEAGIDISLKRPKWYREFEGIYFDYLITLCDGTKDKISSVNIQAKHKIHLGFEDPQKANCPIEQIPDLYRDIRDEIRNELEYFHTRILEQETLRK